MKSYTFRKRKPHIVFVQPYSSVISRGHSKLKYPLNRFWPLDLDVWPLALTYKHDLDILPLGLHAKYKVHSLVREITDIHTMSKHMSRQRCRQKEKKGRKGKRKEKKRKKERTQKKKKLKKKKKKNCMSCRQGKGMTNQRVWWTSHFTTNYKKKCWYRFVTILIHTRSLIVGHPPWFQSPSYYKNFGHFQSTSAHDPFQ